MYSLIYNIIKYEIIKIFLHNNKQDLSVYYDTKNIYSISFLFTIILKK